MISAQTLRVCREGKPAPTFPDHALLVQRFLGPNHIGILPDLILRSVAQAMRLEGWPRATAVQAAILRDARKSALLRMRSARVDPKLIGFMESVV